MSIKISLDDHYKTWSEIATPKTVECCRALWHEDPNFIGEYYKWKKRELKHHKEWSLKDAAAVAQYARENKKFYIAKPKEFTSAHTNFCVPGVQAWCMWTLCLGPNVAAIRIHQLKQICCKDW